MHLLHRLDNGGSQWCIEPKSRGPERLATLEYILLIKATCTVPHLRVSVTHVGSPFYLLFSVKVESGAELGLRAVPGALLTRLWLCHLQTLKSVTGCSCRQTSCRVEVSGQDVVSIHGAANTGIKVAPFPLLLVTATHKSLFCHLMSMGCRG